MQTNTELDTVSWSPKQYHRFSDERSRPYFDLLSQVNLADPQNIADLGCGSGELTATLAERWPDARVYGIDSSVDMVAEAAAHAIPGRLSFSIGEIQTWIPTEPYDLIVANASFQWVQGHDLLLPRFAKALAPGGVLAFQVPGNFGAPSHTILAELRQSNRWKSALGTTANRSASVLEPSRYLKILANLGMKATVWETTYLHVLQGDDAVLEWTKGTALRPVVSVLSTAEQTEFLSEYSKLLRQAYRADSFGTIFPFRRIFVVASNG